MFVKTTNWVFKQAARNEAFDVGLAAFVAGAVYTVMTFFGF